MFFCYPEPSGLSLEEISIVYQYGFGIAKSREIRAAHKAAKQEVQERSTQPMGRAAEDDGKV